MLTLLKFGVGPPFKIVYGEHGKLQHSKFKPVFHSLPAVDTETLPI